MMNSSYRMTELGPIPEDWEVKRFDDTFEHVSSKPFQLQSSEYREGGRFQVVDQGQMEIVGYTDDAKKLFRVPRGGVIIFGDHTRIIKFRESDFVVGADGTQLLVGKKDYTRFLFYALQQLDIPNVGYARHFKYIKEGRYVIPSNISEQRRIAGALSDVDELISALGKLIEKKRNIKTGAMQQLLTGKTRLPGFGANRTEFKQTELGPIPVDWEMKRLGTVGESIRGVSFRPEQSSLMLMPNTTMLLRANNIQNNKICCQDVVYVMNECISDCQQLIEGDILICAANGSRNLVGKAAVWRKAESSTFGAFMAVFRCVKGVDSCFVGYLFQSQCYRRQLDDILTGSAINNLNAKDIEGLAFAFPTLAEQKAIAAVLSDMDAEIAALEVDRAKYERIKSGMMQELLTGKTRLKGE